MAGVLSLVVMMALSFLASLTVQDDFGGKVGKFNPCLWVFYRTPPPSIKLEWGGGGNIGLGSHHPSVSVRPSVSDFVQTISPELLNHF